MFGGGCKLGCSAADDGGKSCISECLGLILLWLIGVRLCLLYCIGICTDYMTICVRHARGVGGIWECTMASRRLVAFVTLVQHVGEASLCGVGFIKYGLRHFRGPLVTMDVLDIHPCPSAFPWEKPPMMVVAVQGVPQEYFLSGSEIKGPGPTERRDIGSFKLSPVYRRCQNLPLHSLVTLKTGIIGPG